MGVWLTVPVVGLHRQSNDFDDSEIKAEIAQPFLGTLNANNQKRSSLTKYVRENSVLTGASWMIEPVLRQRLRLGQYPIQPVHL